MACGCPWEICTTSSASGVESDSDSDFVVVVMAGEKTLHREIAGSHEPAVKCGGYKLIDCATKLPGSLT